MLDGSETANAADLQKAVEKVIEAHYLFDSEGYLQWTLEDIPAFADGAYVLVGAYLGADDFSQAANPDWLKMGMRMVQGGIHIALDNDELDAEYF